MSNVTQFPRFKLTDVPASLRTLAAQIEAGDRPAIRVVVCMETEGGGFDYCAIGRDFCKAHAVGLLRFCENEILGNET